MLRLSAVLCALLIACVANGQDGPICPKDLPSEVMKAINTPTPASLRRSSLGIFVEALGNVSGAAGGVRKDPHTGRLWSTLFDYRAEEYKTPASNNKVPTLIGAYLTHGKDFTFDTSFYASPLVPSSSSLDTLCVYPRGDPTHTTDSLAAAVDTVLAKLGAGVKTVKQLVLDNSYFWGPAYPSSWEWEDLLDTDGAFPVASILNAQTVRLTVSASQQQQQQQPSITFASPAEAEAMQGRVINRATIGAAGSVDTLRVSYELGSTDIFVTGQIPAGAPARTFARNLLDPATHFVRVLAALIRQRGVAVDEVVLASCAPSTSSSSSSSSSSGPAVPSAASTKAAALSPILTVHSPPLHVIMNHTMQVSDNLEAEIFLQIQGIGSPGFASTRDAGIAATKKTLAARFPWMVEGGELQGMIQYDGSGISKNDMLTPRAVAGMFEGMMDDLLFRSFLPTAGVSGTIGNRFHGTPAFGILHAKTGSLTGVNGLSGYLAHKDFPLIVFSIMSNHADRPNAEVRKQLDGIGVLLARLRPC